MEHGAYSEGSNVMAETSYGNDFGAVGGQELCLSELYALLQSSVSTLDESPHKSLDTLTLLMEQICSQQGIGRPLIKDWKSLF